MMDNIGGPIGSGKKRKRSNLRTIAIIVLIVVLIAATGITYLGVTVVSTIKSIIQPPRNGTTPQPSISTLLIEQDLLSYNSIRQYMPLVLLKYSSYNVSNINANASLLAYPAPSRIYILNISNECFYCGSSSEIEAELYKKLIEYNMIKSPTDILTIYPSGLLSIPNDSLVIVLNGLMPSTFFSKVSENLTVLDYLMNRHTSILYVGQTFSNMLLPDSVVTPSTYNPGYLVTDQFSGNSLTRSNYYFNRSTFRFDNGTVYAGYLTYINIYNGSIAAFPNTPNAWQSPTQAGDDIARAVQQMFWLPRYAYGTRIITTPNTANSMAEFGVVMNATRLNYSASFAPTVDRNGSVRVVIAANAIYSYGASNSVYSYINTKPLLYNNGTLGITASMVTNQTVSLTFSIVTHSNTPVNIQPHLTIYDMNLTQISTTPLSFIHNVSNNFTFLLPYQRLVLPPGRGYIIKLHSFYGTEYAGAFFNVSPIVLYLVSANLTADKFYFSVTSNRQPVSNLGYTLALNNQYQIKGVIKNGSIFFTVPQGTPTIRGNLNFTLNTSGSTFYYHTSYNPLPFKINRQYLEIVVAVILMLILVIFVRAPNRDEFYIDVPSLPEEKKIPIRLKANEIMGVFDRLDLLYHWKYMPLSKSEIKFAIVNYIKYNNVPVSMTYSNIDRVLDQLTVKNYLETVDNLYAPTKWIKDSNHDMEYLAAFKKLRLFLVTHAFIFTDMDMSTNCDILATLRNERKYIVIYSKTSKFQNIPVFTGSKTYMVFLNAYRLEDFRNSLYSTTTTESETLKMYIAAGTVRLVDADDPNELVA
jgi:hypothetical protein